jgi:vacuolar-type H+-ATPase subunit C/Vma6
MTDLLVLLRRSRYGSELEACSDKSIDHILSKFPYKIMMREALSALAGYPFRAATVASGMTLKLLEIRNLRLAISAVSGKLSRNSALEAMVIY